MVNTDKVEAKPPTTPSNRPRGKILTSDNYCVPQRGFVEMARRKEISVDNWQTVNVNCIAVNHVPTSKKGSL